MHSEDHLDTRAATVMWDLVEDCVYAYECDYREGNPRSLDQYLPDGDEALRNATMIELVKVDLELQWKQGCRKDLGEYCDRYSELGSTELIPPDLVYEAYLVECKHGRRPDIEQFCRRFPRQRDMVLDLAQRTVQQSTAIERQEPSGPWQVGGTYGDFELLAVLGEGAFGKVFLAREKSLARQVALKVTANRGSEARTMASLEHDNIVQVFSELVVPEFDTRLLCMQYVPGTTLGKIIRRVAEEPNALLTGSSIIQAIDDLSVVPAMFQASSLAERQRLAESDQIEAVTLLGSQLAGALAYAHERGVLHRDIKPDNILASQYGRPLLVDFNLSLDPHQVEGTGTGMFGGSLGYMAPEHLDAFNPSNPTRPEAVDKRSDVFSLGVVLFELLYLRRPFGEPTPGRNQVQVLADMATERRSPLPDSVTKDAAATEVLDGVIRRCLRPDPSARYQSANDLRHALDAGREFHGIRKALPTAGRLTELAMRQPLLMLFLAVLVPSLLGSGVNIWYNMLRIVGYLTPDQLVVFQRLVVAYNLIVYPLCTLLLVRQAWPIFFRREGEDAAKIRRRIVTLPAWILVLGAIGWLPGGFAFPLGLHMASGPLPWSIFGHFVMDFFISGMIAVTYSYFGAEAIMMRVLYPQFLAGQTQPRCNARAELPGVSVRIRAAQIAAGMIPLIGASLLVLVGPDDVQSYGMFQLLVMCLIGLGMAGFSLSLTTANTLQQTIQALTGQTKLGKRA